MAHAGAADQAEARQLLAAAGEVNPYSAFAMSDEPDGTVRVAFEFDGGDVARTNADTRAVLARGPAPGQGGTFGERFRVTSVTAHGSLVTMTLDAAAGRVGALGPEHRAAAVRDLLSRRTTRGQARGVRRRPRGSRRSRRR